MTEPRLIAPDFDGIPQAMKLLPRWILWRSEQVAGRWTKVPYRLDAKTHASTSDPRTWAPFDSARKAYERGGVSGVGFCRAGQMVFVDVDGGIVMTPTGVEFVNFPGWPESLQPRHLALAFRMNGNWCEISPSGTGFHAYATSGASPGSIQLMVAGEAHMGVAVYTLPRFFAVTGRELWPDQVRGA